MIDKLKEFVAAHRYDFDTLEAPAELWNSIETKLTGKSGNWIKSKLSGKPGLLGFSASAIAVLVTTYLTLQPSEKPAALQNPKFSANRAAVNQRVGFSSTLSNNNPTEVEQPGNTNSNRPMNPKTQKNMPAIDSIKTGGRIHSTGDTIGHAGSTHNCVARPASNPHQLTAALINNVAATSAEPDSLGFADKSSLSTHAWRSKYDEVHEALSHRHILLFHPELALRRARHFHAFAAGACQNDMAGRTVRNAGSAPQQPGESHRRLLGLRKDQDAFH